MQQTAQFSALWLAAKAAGKLLAYLLADQPSLVRSMVVRPRTANWRAGKLFSLFCLYVKRLRSITCGRFQHGEMGRSCTAAKQMPCRADWALLLQLCSFAPVRERPREAEESVRSSSLPPFLSLLLFPWRGFSGPRPSLPFFPFFFLLLSLPLELLSPKCFEI